MDLRTSSRTALRLLNVVDEFTPDLRRPPPGLNNGAQEVQRTLARLFEEHGRPQVIRSDNGREFIATSLLTWLKEQGVEPVQVAKASPQQNGYIERFNGSMRDELLNREVLHSLTEARVVIEHWVEHYNNERPHAGLEMRTPVAYAAYIATQPSLSTAPCESG